MTTSTHVSIDAPTQFLDVQGFGRYAYRRFGSGPGLPLILLQHFTGTLDNWDPGLTDALADGRELILFDNAGVGRSSGKVPTTVAEMARHALTFLDGLGLSRCDVLGFSLGGMVAQQLAADRPSLVRRLVLVGTAPRGGEQVMTFQTPRIGNALRDPSNKGYSVLQQIFFPETPTAQAAGAALVERLGERTTDLEGASGPDVAAAQMAAFREWDKPAGERFAYLRAIRQPALVVNGVHDEMIPVRNSYWLSENLPNAIMLIYPNAGHGSLFQYHESFARHANAFLSLDSDSAVY